MKIEIDPAYDRSKHTSGYASFFDGRVVVSYRTQHDIMGVGDFTIASSGESYEWNAHKWDVIPMPEIPPEVKTYLFFVRMEIQ